RSPRDRTPAARPLPLAARSRRDVLSPPERSHAAERHDLGAGTARAGTVEQLALQLLGASLHPCELLAHLDEQLHARQADAFSLRQFQDHLDARDVALGIETRVARRAL